MTSSESFVLPARAWAVVLGGALGFAAGCADPEITGSVNEETFTSEAAQSDYTILIRTPPSYGSSDSSYPVVYQLDATFLGEFDKSAATISRLEDEGIIPEAIVVGIGHVYSGNGRDHDFVPADPEDPSYTGGAREFYTFLRDELVPYVEANYRVTSSRTLIGHSLGGLFALYAFFQAEPGGALFQNVLAADPSYGTNDGVIFHFESELAKESPTRPGRLFLTASLYTGGAQRFPHDEMTRRIQRDFAGLEMKSTYEETDHGGLIQVSFDEGIPFLLGGQQ